MGGAMDYLRLARPLAPGTPCPSRSRAKCCSRWSRQRFPRCRRTSRERRHDRTAGQALRVLVLGAGMQGRAALHDLAASPVLSSEIVAADRDILALKRYAGRARPRRACASAVPSTRPMPRALERLVAEGFDVVADLLPPRIDGSGGGRRNPPRRARRQHDVCLAGSPRARGRRIGEARRHTPGIRDGSGHRPRAAWRSCSRIRRRDRHAELRLGHSRTVRREQPTQVQGELDIRGCAANVPARRGRHPRRCAGPASSPE